MSEEVTTKTTVVNQTQWMIPAAIVIAGVCVGIGLYLGLNNKQSNTATQGQQQEELITTKAQMQERIKPVGSVYVDPTLAGKEPITIGHADAPLTLTYWYDYQCPFCKAVDVGHPQIPIQPSMPLILSKYVQTGKAKLVFKAFPFLGNDSITATEYAHAVWALYPDKFFEWHTDMMHVQDAEGDTGFGNAETIDTMTGLIKGIDVAKVRQYIASNKSALDTVMNQEKQDAADKGVNGTPAMLVGTKMISGAQGLDVFQATIEEELKKVE